MTGRVATIFVGFMVGLGFYALFTITSSLVFGRLLGISNPTFHVNADRVCTAAAMGVTYLVMRRAWVNTLPPL